MWTPVTSNDGWSPSSYNSSPRCYCICCPYANTSPCTLTERSKTGYGQRRAIRNHRACALGCSRMITFAKKDGTPCSTVGSWHLNSASVRQTHHTQSPFHQAPTVYNNTKKTLCDSWNDYHSISIWEDDRDLTTFIKLWGRYRYRTLSRGYLAAGDAYPRRYDEIISEILDKAKVVGDTILWSSDIAECFFLTCGSSGIILGSKNWLLVEMKLILQALR